jgi:CheY-like chemotaxis protein
LLVDDNHEVREITALLLRDSGYGYGVIEASSGIAALGALDANPAIEVLIVDFSMPGVSGIELLERARAKRPEIRVVFITGYVGHTWLHGNLADEIVVKKPFTMGPASARRAQGVGRIRHLSGSAITHKERRLQSPERFLPPLTSRVSPLAF